MRDKLQRDIDAHIASVRASKLAELTSSFEVQLHLNFTVYAINKRRLSYIFQPRFLATTEKFSLIMLYQKIYGLPSKLSLIPY